MKRKRMALWTLVLLLTLALAQSAGAYSYYAPGPSGTVGLSSPTISQQFRLGTGELITRVDMWLDGVSVQATWDLKGLVSYTPPLPLSKGTHKVKMSVYVKGYSALTHEFSFTVADGALSGVPAPDPESLRALDHLNALRTAAGLPAMAYSAALGAAAGGHARYLVANSVSGHYQEQGAPLFFGVTPGDRVRYYGYAGSSGEVVAQEGPAEEALDLWIASLYHRLSLISPGNREMGYGQAGTGRRANVVETGPNEPVPGAVVPWPYPGQTGVAVGWPGLESPDPLRLYPGTEGPLGYTVTLTFAGGPRALTLATASLTGPGGSPIPVMTFSPVNDDHLDDTVAMIPYAPLLPESTYTAKLSGSVDYGQGAQSYSREWSFTTAPGLEPDFRSAYGSRIGGTGFSQGMRVFLGGLPVRNLVVESSTAFRFDPPQGYDGATDLLVVTPEGREDVWGDFKLSAAAEPEPFRSGTYTLSLSGRVQTVPAQVHAGGTIMLAASVLKELGLQMYEVPGLGRIYWTQGQSTGDVVPGSAVARIGGRQVLLDLPVQLRDGELMVPAAFVEALSKTVGLKDVGDHWAREAIVRLVDVKIIAGFPDRSFRPNESLSRAAFIKMLVAARRLPLRIGDTSSFTDLDGHWLADQGYLGAAVLAGIVRPGEYPGRRLEPDQSITRAEIAVMVVRAMGLDAIAGTRSVAVSGGQVTIAGRTFVDAGLWARPGYIAVAVEKGIVSGYAETGSSYSYRPANPATRAEAAVMITRMLDAH